MFSAASRLGFGCASLGSRVGARAGLNALSDAFDVGINWFDLAPSYGNGDAEGIFSRFAVGRRDKIFICTKCGIDPPRIGPFGAMLAPMARSLISLHPNFRKRITQVRPPAVRVALSGSLVTRSLEASLRRLRTDRVDVLALHDPDTGDLARDDIKLALERAVASGQVRAVGIAGSLEASRAAFQSTLPVHVVQLANNPVQPQCADPLITEVIGKRSTYLTTHSVFGPPGYLAALVTSVRRDGSAETQLRQAGYEGPLDEAIRNVLIDYALKTNPFGTVLISMFAPGHLALNIARVNADRRGDPVHLFDALRSLPRISENHAVDTAAG